MEIVDVGPMRIGVLATRVAGRDFVDIRAYTPDKRGMLIPTSTGILLPIEQCSEILAAAERQRLEALKNEPANLYYFRELVEDKQAPRNAPLCHVFNTAKLAVRKSPEEYGADKNRGYIFKCNKYEHLKSSYRFSPTKPFAVWDAKKGKWVRW